MLSEKDNDALSRVGPGTPGGELLRRYWHPIAASVELEESPFRTKELMILGEELVLYRDRRGTLGLLERFCSHRRVNLAIGVVEDDGLRCQYHGWKFNELGACVEQPFEDTLHPEALFRQKCGLASYPVKELAGLVFAYMGPLPAPELPSWEPLTWSNAVRDIAVTELPCNWLQCQENSVDPIHNEWLHNYFGNYVSQIRQEQSFAYLGTAGRPTKKIGFDQFEYGIIKRRMVEGDTGEEEDWKVGHPILFPNVLLTGNQFGYTMQFRVPIDDERTYHVSQYIFHAAPGQQAPRQAGVPYRVVPLRENEKQWILNYTFNQDYMAWFTQGPIAKRHLEKLGESDRGVILFRFMLQQQIERVREGEDPINVFRDAAKAACLSFPMEKVKHGRTRRPTYRPGEAGFSRDAELIEETLATWDAIPEHRREPVAAR
ncbi:MAG: Rieske 2Fe-2S domain-containing protein [Chloroflexota bacterium]